MQTTTGLTWAWELISPEPSRSQKGKGRTGRGTWREVGRERSIRELMETGERFLRGSELPVRRSEQAESVKPCVLEGVSNVLSEAGSRVGRGPRRETTKSLANIKCAFCSYCPALAWAQQALLPVQAWPLMHSQYGWLTTQKQTTCNSQGFRRGKFMA